MVLTSRDDQSGSKILETGFNDMAHTDVRQQNGSRQHC
jgi:hypothetical protein